MIFQSAHFEISLLKFKPLTFIWPAWLTILLNPKYSLLQRTLGWSHPKVLYAIILFTIILKARTYFWLVYFLYVGKFSPYLKAPANQKNQEISHLPENS